MNSIVSKGAFVALWLFVLSMPSEKTFEIPGIGTISRLTGLLAMGAGALAVAVEGRFRLPGAPHLLMLAFVLWAGLSYRWSLSPEHTHERLMTNIQLLAVPFLVWNLCGTESRCLALLDAYVIGTLSPSAQTLERFLSGKQTFYNRYAMEGFDPNDLALTLALSIPMAYFLSMKRAPKWKAIYVLHIVAACGTIFLTASRGGTVAMLIGLSLILWTLPMVPAASRVRILASGAVGLVAALALIPAASWNRLLTLTSEISEGTLNSRSVLWREGWRAFQDVPLEGIGAGAFPVAVGQAFGQPWHFVPVAHNSFLSVLVETGVVGFLLFGAMLILLAATAARLPHLDRFFWLTTLVVWAVGVSALTWEYRKPTWFLFGAMTAHIAARSRDLTSEGVLS